jgi:hypothetical protein
VVVNSHSGYWREQQLGRRHESEPEPECAPELEHAPKLELELELGS